jgi:hypothetical protein
VWITDDPEDELVMRDIAKGTRLVDSSTTVIPDLSLAPVPLLDMSASSLPLGMRGRQGPEQHRVFVASPWGAKTSGGTVPRSPTRIHRKARPSAVVERGAFSHKGGSF